MDLTPRQEEILASLKAHERRVVAASIRELAEANGMCINALVQHLRNLAIKGRIKLPGGGKARSIEIIQRGE